ncbi:MAG: anti-sigma factor antagonist [Nostocales cyanobacterium]|nr:MAG: anti-sigma factor antagonist [Nostocales cyanobacterium]TAF07977.1 MAG: anti-sigma factor antagonist [Nostocales cyanobacterium]
MNIEQKTYANSEGNNIVIVLQPKERLDITTAWQFRLKLQECISKLSRHVVVNLEQVDFIDSSGLTSLVAGMRDADKVKGSFRICNVHPDAKLVFEVTMMDTVFEIFETEQEAVNAVFPYLVRQENQNNEPKSKNIAENSPSVGSKP